jgi:hypothetical protein
MKRLILRPPTSLDGEREVGERLVVRCAVEEGFAAVVSHLPSHAHR